jgi:hypothetical protein
MADEAGALIGYLLGTIYVGYAVGGDYKNAAIHGALAAFLVTIFGPISIDLSILLTSAITQRTIEIITLDASLFVYLLKIIVINVIIGLIGGALGFLLKTK